MPDRDDTFEVPGRKPQALPSSPRSDSMQPADSTSLLAATPPQIDVLFVLTPIARASITDIQRTINERIAQTQTIFDQSGISARIASVGWMAISEEPTLRDLADFWRNKEILKQRLARKADVVVGIGIADPVAHGYAANTYVNWEHAGASVSHDAFRDASSRTFTHELGHLLGADHDPANVRGVLTFGAGMGYVGYCRDWIVCHATVMGVGCPRIDYFSSPSLLFHGTYYGSSTQNNAALLRLTAPVVAAYSDEMIRAAAAKAMPAIVVSLLD